MMPAAWSQPADPSVTFEVASIKQSPPPDGGPIGFGCRGGPGSPDPGRITCSHFNVANMVATAYGLPHYQVAGVSFSDNNFFELALKVPEGATKDQVRVMWQNLLKERFKLAIHREKRDAQVFELVVAKGGLKIRESAPPPANPDTAVTGARSEGPPKLNRDGFPELPGRERGMIMMAGKARWRLPEGTMDQLCNMLAGQLGQPVNDGTGLTGKYFLELYWATDNGIMPGTRVTTAPVGHPGGAQSPVAALPEADSGPSLQSAVQSQLGLTLEKKRGQIEMLVVDHAEKVPTEN